MCAARRDAAATESNINGQAVNADLSNEDKKYDYYIKNHHYRMESHPKGKCIIVNNKTFDNGTSTSSHSATQADAGPERLDNRDGSDVDRDALADTFSRLDFEVEIHNDLTSSKMTHLMQDMSRTDYSKNDGFIACFLSHGCLGKVFGTDGVAVDLKDLTGPMKPSICRSLSGKPKVFFVQACQGKDTKKGHKNMARDCIPTVDDLVPEDGDYLLGYCTTPGSTAFRDAKRGSPYIAILTDLINKYADTKNMLDILTMVNQAVGQQHIRVNGESVKQMPSPSYTLRKKLYLDTSKLQQALLNSQESDSGVLDLFSSLPNHRGSRTSVVSMERDAPPVNEARSSCLLKQGRFQHSAMQQCYKISVFTSPGVPGAGTDANVSIVLFGKNGQTGEICLQESQTHKDPFEKGHTDLFTILEDKNLGDLNMVRIWHDNKGGKAGWHLEKVEVQDMSTLKTYNFPCGQWLSKTKGDKQVERDLMCFEVLSSRKYSVADCKRTDYKIIVRTSDVRGAGTDANVYVILTGEEGDSSELHLMKSELHKNPFERGNTDIFTFKEVRCLGSLSKLRVWHDNKGPGAAWHLASIEVEDLSSQQHYLFTCGQWLSTNEGDRRIFRELACINPFRFSNLQNNLSDYRFHVKTSHVLGAGTDANVFVVLYGKAESRPLALKESETNKDPFEEGQTDVFTMRAQPHLGQLHTLRVWHDNKGLGAAWHLAYIAVDDLKDNQTYTFHCGRWLSKKDEDKQIERVLLNPSVNPIETPIHMAT